MKKALGIAAIFLLLLAGTVFVFRQTLALRAARAALVKALPDYRVTLDGAKLNLNSLELQNLRVKNQTIDGHFGRIRFYVTPRSLMKKRWARMTLENAVIDLPQELKISDISLQAENTSQTGTFSAGKINLKKINITGMQGKFRWTPDQLNAESFSAALLGGSVSGNFSLTLDAAKKYECYLEFKNLQLPVLITAMKWAEKISLTGKLGGQMKFTGDVSGLKNVDGAFSGAAGGGDLTILDRAFMENIAARAKQPVELVEASLKEYHYDEGVVSLQKKGHDLNLELAVRGPKGRRHLNTVFHDAV